MKCVCLHIFLSKNELIIFKEFLPILSLVCLFFLSLQFSSVQFSFDLIPAQMHFNIWFHYRKFCCCCFFLSRCVFFKLLLLLGCWVVKIILKLSRKGPTLWCQYIVLPFPRLTDVILFYSFFYFIFSFCCFLMHP